MPKQLICYAFMIAILCFGAACKGPQYYSKKIIQPVLETPVIDSIQQERDNIFSLLTYTIVYNDWQPASVPREKRRGYNIAALLVNKDNTPVQYGLNAINVTENATQHGEVRAITSYLEKTRAFNLDGFTIYTSLEPCVMCAGMMIMTSVQKCVFGQHDIDYSKAFERLSIDTRDIGGFPSYPRKVTAIASSTDFCKQLDEAYQSFLQTDSEKILAKFLTTPAAETIYQKAAAAFLNYHVQYPDNQVIYEKALSFYNSIKK
ncbi:MAG: nucleoside deaminase [Chitinophagaceae bacterium]